MMVRIVLASLLAIAAVLWIDRATRAAGLQPPGFRSPERRGLALAGLGFCLLIGVFSPLTTFGLEVPAASVDAPVDSGSAAVFLLHGIFLFSLCLWFAMGYLGVPGVDWRAGRRIAHELGMLHRSWSREVFIGLWAGLAAWGVVLAGATAMAALLSWWGWELEQQTPELVTTLVALPVAHRVLIAVSAGVVEELFFRGFLQRRLGILASTICFVAGHLGYGQLFLLFGVTLLSLIYAALVRWRGSLLAAMVAHALFDAIQLLVVIPAALRWVEGSNL